MIIGHKETQTNVGEDPSSDVETDKVYTSTRDAQGYASPYEETLSDEVERLLTEKKFPDVSGIPCGQIIKQCWLSQVDSAAHVQAAIRDITSRTINVDCTPRLDGLDIGPDTLIDLVVSP